MCVSPDFSIKGKLRAGCELVGVAVLSCLSDLGEITFSLRNTPVPFGGCYDGALHVLSSLVVGYPAPSPFLEGRGLLFVPHPQLLWSGVLEPLLPTCLLSHEDSSVEAGQSPWQVSSNYGLLQMGTPLGLAAGSHAGRYCGFPESLLSPRTYIPLSLLTALVSLLPHPKSC